MTWKSWAAIAVAAVVGLTLFARHERALGEALSRAQAQVARDSVVADSIARADAERDSTAKVSIAIQRQVAARASVAASAAQARADSLEQQVVASPDSTVPKAQVLALAAADSQVIANLRHQVAAQDSAIALFSAELSGKDTTIAALQHQLGGMRSQLAMAIGSQQRGFLGDVAHTAGTVLEVVGAVELVKAGLGHP